MLIEMSAGERTTGWPVNEDDCNRLAAQWQAGLDRKGFKMTIAMYQDAFENSKQAAGYDLSKDSHGWYLNTQTVAAFSAFLVSDFTSYATVLVAEMYAHKKAESDRRRVPSLPSSTPLKFED